MASPQVEAAEIIAAATDRQTAAIEAQTAAIEAQTFAIATASVAEIGAANKIGRERLVGNLVGQLFSNVAFRNSVRIPRLSGQTQDEVAVLATEISEI